MLAHKIRIYPNNEQETYLKKSCGVARFAYNWALAHSIEQYKQNKDYKFSEASLRKELNSIKREEYPWMLEVSKCAPQLAIKNGLNNAFKRFFKKQGGYPNFKRKGIRDSFQLDNLNIKLTGKAVKLPLLKQPIKMAEELKYTNAKILSATVSRRADQWYISIQVELESPKPKHTTVSENQAIGVDLGITDLAVLSNGEKITGSKHTKKYAKQLRRNQQFLSRKKGSKKGEKTSNNYIKQRLKVSRLHKKMADSRIDELHKLSTYLTDNFGLIGLEDLNIEGMVKNHNLSKSIHDQSWGEFKRQIEYKAKITGSRIVYADRFFPSSQLCSSCGYQNKEVKNLAIRGWICPECGAIHDRDINAAINLKNLALRNIA